ncbi:MAG TPA: hypothetical protein PKH37_03040 [Alphaproteobacteria bacterium]|nr:hypothetical protein [Alphaproteobacteria bacterium]
MSEAVTVDTSGGTPRIAVDVGGVTRYASYASGTGGSALTFTYTPQVGDVDLDGVTVSSPVDLNGGTIVDLNGNPITNLTFTPPNTANVKVDYPSLSMDFINSDYILSGTHYATLPSFLTAAGGSFTRNSVGTYFDSSGNLQTAGNNTPRFDHDPVTHVAKGILIEEQRTNGVRNNNMQGSVAGTLGGGGVLPTTWQTTGSNGISIAVNGTGTESGISYIDIRFFGTTTTAGPRGVAFNTLTGCSATPSGNNKLSAYLKLQAGNLTNVSYWALIGQGRDIGGTPTGEYRASTPVFTSAALSQQRYNSSLVFTNAATDHYMPYLEFYPTGAGVPIDVTVRVGMPQCEQGAFVTSVIPTTNATVTRQSDIITVPTGGWYSQLSGTLYGYGTSVVMGIDHRLATVRKNASDYYGLRVTAANQAQLVAYDVGGIKSVTSGGVVPSGDVKIAAVQNSNDLAVAYNGGSLNSSAAWSPVTAAYLAIGYDGVALASGFAFMNGYIKGIKYYPNRISNTQLQLLTQ